MPSMAARREPAINIPAPLLVLIGLLVAIHAIREFLPTETDLGLLLEGAFLPAPWSLALGITTPDAVIAAARAGAEGEAADLRLALAEFVVRQPLRPWSLLSYSFLHGSWPHLGVNCLWLAAFGALVVRRIGVARAAILWLASALGGALAHWLGDPTSVDIMIGASASISGFMAAAATFMYGPSGAGRWAFLRNRNVLVFLGVWVLANIVFAVIAGPLGLTDGAIAWRAHLGGLAVALAVFPFLDRPTSAPRPPLPA